jgi:hypothetical protein
MLQINFQLPTILKQYRKRVGHGDLEAQISALRWHDVTIFRKNKVLGGNLISAEIPDFKQEFIKLIKYYSKQLIGRYSS